jgi:hypothetical protein
MHCPTHGQWWSNRSTQLLHIEQWEHLGGRKTIQVSQYFTFTSDPLTITSFTRGNCSLPGVAPDNEFPYVKSSSGGCNARGTIPGSWAEVIKSNASTCNVHDTKQTFLLSWMLSPFSQELLPAGSQESAQWTYIDHKYNCYRRNCISCIVSWELVAEMSCHKHAEDQDRYYDEKDREEQGLDVRSEYQPPTKEEFLQTANQARQNATMPHMGTSKYTARRTWHDSERIRSDAQFMPRSSKNSKTQYKAPDEDVLPVADAWATGPRASDPNVSGRAVRQWIHFRDAKSAERYSKKRNFQRNKEDIRVTPDTQFRKQEEEPRGAEVRDGRIFTLFPFQVS